MKCRVRVGKSLSVNLESFSYDLYFVMKTEAEAEGEEEKGAENAIKCAHTC